MRTQFAHFGVRWQSDSATPLLADAKRVRYSTRATAALAMFGLILEFDPENELQLRMEAGFYYAPPVPLRRESTRGPNAQPVPHRAMRSFNHITGPNTRGPSQYAIRKSLTAGVRQFDR
jgi:hypothetical protein